MSIGELIQQRRKECKVSRETLSEETGISRVTIWRIEKSSEGTWYNIRKLIEALGMRVEISE